MKYTHAILGGTGHIGSSLSNTLLQEQQSILIIGHDLAKADEWIAKGAAFETADILDTERLRYLFQQTECLFILNPPAPPDSDVDAVERKQINSILSALKGLKLKKIVAASTYGAQKGDQIFDLGTLFDLEDGLHQLDTPIAIIRSAYYMSNFDQVLPMVKEKLQLITLFPSNFKLPMVAPEDIGKFAAMLLQDDRTGLFFIEGPESYSNQDAANVFSELLNKKVSVMTIPESGWIEFLTKGGFSEKTAKSFANMIKLTIDQSFEAYNPEHGSTSLKNYLKKQF